ncbi:unnamed protein product [Auanema sp. JU1783]|nr:unnamed protein product [Auanema sp. JU1783]
MNPPTKRVSYSDSEQNATMSHCVSSTRDSVCEMDDSNEAPLQPFVFDPNDPKYLCLCGHAHSVTGVRLMVCLLFITIFADAYELLVTFYFSNEINKNIKNQSGNFSRKVYELNEEEVFNSFLTLSGGLLLICSLLIAMKYKKPKFLIPYLIIQGVGLVSVALLGMINLLMALSDQYRDTLRSHVYTNYPTVTKSPNKFSKVKSSKDNSPDQSFNYLLKFGIYLFLFGFQVWLALVSISCWKYLRDIHQPRNHVEELAANAVFKGLRRSLSAEDVTEKKKRKRVPELRSVSVRLDKHPVLTV